MKFSADEDRLHLLLGRLVHAFGRLDFYIGLQLKWLGPYRGVKVDHLLDAKLPFKHRLDALKPLVIEMYAHTDQAAHDLYQTWFERVKNAKAIRNDYAHGRWGGFTPVKEGFEFVALSWEMDPLKQTAAVHMTFDDLERSVAEVERLFGEYMSFEKRFRMQGRPSKEWEEVNRPQPPREHYDN
jgi:hypothetical protein